MSQRKITKFVITLAKTTCIRHENIADLMSDLTHRSLASKVHLNIAIENVLYKFITINSLPLLPSTSQILRLLGKSALVRCLLMLR